MRTSTDRNLVTVPPPQVFADVANDVPAILIPLIKRLTQYCYAIENGRVIVPIARTHLSSASVLIDAVRVTPGLKDHIIFDDGDRRRSFDDVVWDLEKHPRVFTNILAQEQGRVQPIRVVVTPKVTGPGEGNVINCADIKFKEPPLQNLTLAVRLNTQLHGISTAYKNATQLCGHRMIIQTDDITVSGIDQLRMRDEKPEITMRIIAQPTCMRILDTAKPAVRGLEYVA